MINNRKKKKRETRSIIKWCGLVVVAHVLIHWLFGWQAAMIRRQQWRRYAELLALLSLWAPLIMSIEIYAWKSSLGSLLLDLFHLFHSFHSLDLLVLFIEQFFRSSKPPKFVNIVQFLLKTSTKQSIFSLKNKKS